MKQIAACTALILCLGISDTALAMRAPSFETAVRKSTVSMMDKKSEARGKTRMKQLQHETGAAKVKGSMSRSVALPVFSRSRSSLPGTSKRIAQKKSSSSSRTTVSSSRSSKSSSVRSFSSASKRSISVSEPAGINDVRNAILKRVNDERSKAGLNPLSMNANLHTSAQLYAQDMSDRNFFSHTDPDGRSSIDRIRAVGYLDAPCDCKWHYYTGENLAANITTADGVMNAWMDSTGHRANVLNSHYSEIGIGKYGNYWVQHFGHIQIN